MRIHKQIPILFTLVMLFISINSCKKDENGDAPNETTAEFSISTGETSQLNGDFAMASGKLRLTAGTVMSYGHCWSTFPQPTIESDYNTDFGSENESLEYTSEMDNLKPGTMHYVRAYAKDKDKIIYGNEMAFRTPNLIVGKPYASSLTVNSVNLAAKITIYQDAVAKYGFCWATHDNPSVLDSKKEYSFMEETKTFYAKITELQTGVQYYFRAYAKSNQQAYGPIIPVFLKTINIGKNTLEQTNDTSVLIETEINFTDVSIIQHGHCYSKYPNPDINGLHTELA
jgi:hypothetical protein